MAPSLPGDHTSYWLASTPATDYPSLTEDTTVDVVVVGGGIVGVTTAFLLTRAGLRVVLLEARRIVTGVTGHTTGKVTSLHGLIYSDLVRRHGEERARLYGQANQAALEWIVRTAQDEGIHCDLVRSPAYTFASSERAAAQVREEATTAQRLGLPADLVTSLDLPVPVNAAVRFRDQARFHPRRFLLALAERVVSGGSRICEETRAFSVTGRGAGIYRVRTDKGTVSAPWVVLATLMPFPRRTLFWTRAYPSGHAALALETGEPAPEGMYLGIDAEPHSLRPQPGSDGRTVLIVDSPAQKTGHGSTARLSEELVASTAQVLPSASVSHRWWTMDQMSSDRIPLVGPLHPLASHLLAATGMGAWGMTNGVAAALTLADLVQGVPATWRSLYDPSRLGLSRATLADLVKENGDAVGVHLVLPRLSRGPKGPSGIGPGEGAVVEVARRRVAVSRDASGHLTGVARACTHVGCEVRWNDAEQTWDCPCHGSRFSAEGRMLQGPAAADLGSVDLSG